MGELNKQIKYKFMTWIQFSTKTILCDPGCAKDALQLQETIFASENNSNFPRILKIGAYNWIIATIFVSK